MIGNDIVDLQLANKQSNWQRSGWLQKIFTVTEQKSILFSENPSQLVWRFWSMKEAAYKAHQSYIKHYPKYAPWDYECQPGGEVIVNNHLYDTQTEVTKEYVYSIAQRINTTNYCSTIFKKELDLKLQLKQILAQKLKVDISSVSIKKDTYQIPRLYINNKKEDIPISLTHHGKYSAFAVTL